jgi:hypothetical protein
MQLISACLGLFSRKIALFCRLWVQTWRLLLAEHDLHHFF